MIESTLTKPSSNGAARHPLANNGTQQPVRDEREHTSRTDGHLSHLGRRELSQSEHLVQFYESDAFLLDTLSDFIGTALRAGDAGIVVATAAHREGLEERLRAHGLDVEAARADGRYVSLDAADTLARFMVDGSPDSSRFGEIIEGIIARVNDDGRRLYVFGEMVALLVDAGNHAAALLLEDLWNALQQTRAFTLLCAYRLESLAGKDLSALADDVCARHSHVIPAESYMALGDPDDRLRAVAMLQQKARALEMEIAEQARAAEERAALLTQTLDALRQRDAYLRAVAHDLKTPLTGIKGHAQLLQRQATRPGGITPERLAAGLAELDHSVTMMARLIDQLLT